MGIIGKLVKYSIPTGAIYWTIEQEVWLPGAGSPEAEKRLESQRKAIDETINKVSLWKTSQVDPVIKPYVDTSKLPSVQVAVPDVVQYWNCGVRTAIKSVAEFDAIKTYERISSWSQKTFQATTEETKKEEKTNSPPSGKK